MRCGTCGAALPDFTDPHWTDCVSPARLRYAFELQAPTKVRVVSIDYVCGCGDRYFPFPAQRAA